jgi:hypothetical protein
LVKKYLTALWALLFIVSSLSAIDESSFTVIYSSERIAVYSEDSKDFQDVIEKIEQKFIELETMFNKHIDEVIKFYFFKDQESYFMEIFKTKDPIVRPAANSNFHEREIYIASHIPGYYTYTMKDVRQIAIHELVHQFFRPNQMWVSEGFAEYFSDDMLPPQLESYPDSIYHLQFWGGGREKTRIAYTLSAWFVKYLIEEVCDGDYAQFFQFSMTHNQWSLVGLDSEEDFLREAYDYIKDFEDIYVFNE